MGGDGGAMCVLYGCIYTCVHVFVYMHVFEEGAEIGESVCSPSWGGEQTRWICLILILRVLQGEPGSTEKAGDSLPWGRAAWPASGLGEEGVSRGWASAGARGPGVRLSSARHQLSALGRVPLFLGPPVPIDDSACSSQGHKVIFSGL